MRQPPEPAKIALLSLIFIGLAGCSSLSTNADWNPSTNFAAFHTYSWLPPAQATGTGPHPDQLTDERIQAAINTNLQGKGYRQSQADADFAVGYQVSTSENVSYETFATGWAGAGWRWGGGWGAGMATTEEVETPVGTLVIAIFDTKTRELVWHGSGSGALQTSGSPQERSQKVDSAVDKIMQEFPPPPKGN